QTQGRAKRGRDPGVWITSAVLCDCAYTPLEREATGCNSPLKSRPSSEFESMCEMPSLLSIRVAHIHSFAPSPMRERLSWQVSKPCIKLLTCLATSHAPLPITRVRSSSRSGSRTRDLQKERVDDHYSTRSRRVGSP